MGSRTVADVPLVGGHRALDLVNTVAPRWPGESERDYLRTPDDLLTWATRTGMADVPTTDGIRAVWTHAPGTARRALETVREIREALFTVLAAHLGLSGASPEIDSELEYLSIAAAAAASRSRLELASGSAVAHWTSTSAPALLLPDHAARDAAHLLCQTDTSKLRACNGCGWLFLDQTRNHSRRWCTMADCGTEVKSRRLTERRRATRAVAQS